MDADSGTMLDAAIQLSIAITQICTILLFLFLACVALYVIATSMDRRSRRARRATASSAHVVIRNNSR